MADTSALENLSCQMCGVARGEANECTGKMVEFNIDLIGGLDLGGITVSPELRVLCSSCKRGAHSITAEKPTTIWLLSQIRRAGQDEQRAVLAALIKKFGICEEARESSER